MEGLRFSYVTNGLVQHRLTDAVAMLADLGYDGVAVTLDPHHLDPFAPDLGARVSALAKLLQDRGLAVVVETGASFLLDPRRKHEPTLVSTEGRQRRVDFLRRAVAIAADLGAEVVSFWSGTVPAGTPDTAAWQRLADGCAEVLAAADEYGVTLGFEPEPGMLVDRLDGYDKLVATLGHPERLGLTLDIGHCVCVEDESVPACIARAAPRLVNVHIEDMRRAVHDHLDFGHGDVEFPEALEALHTIGYTGLVSVELSRHSHTAHSVMPKALHFLKNAEPKALHFLKNAEPKALHFLKDAEGEQRRLEDRARLGGVLPGSVEDLWESLRATAEPDRLSWFEDATEAVVRDRSVLATVFPAVGRRLGRQLLAPVRQDGDDGQDEHAWTVDDAGRVLLLLAVGDGTAEEVDDLYRFGDAAERRAVLRSLPFLPDTVNGLALVDDALRTNDPRLIAAALNPYGLDRLDDEALNQAVLKCVFVGVRLPGDVTDRATPELSEMLAGYVHERVAAGREVPLDVWPIVEAHPPLEVLAAIEAEVDHGRQDRRDAAAAALAQRDECRQRRAVGTDTRTRRAT
jgi:sugar phosphate isomerase/epimerase